MLNKKLISKKTSGAFLDSPIPSHLVFILLGVSIASLWPLPAAVLLAIDGKYFLAGCLGFTGVLTLPISFNGIRLLWEEVFG